MDFGEEEDILVDDREAEEREECIQDVLELVIERVNAHLEKAELQGKVVGYAVGEAIKDALAVVDMTFVERESHATEPGKADAEQDRGSWEPDEEPIPGEVDAWARGSVPARRRAKTPAAEPKATGGRPSVPHRKSLASSVKSGGYDQRRQSTSLPATKEPKGKTPKAKLSPEEAEREQRLRDEIASRKAVQEMQRLQIEKDKEELKQLELLQKELRGKEYGYDHNGQVVVLNKLDPEKLPAYAVGLRVNVFDNMDGFDDPAMADAADRAKKGKKGEEKVAKKANETLDFIQQVQGGQPSVMQTMQVAMGVTLREGGGVKPGPKQVPSKEHMSRSDYMTLVGRQEASDAAPDAGDTLKAATPTSDKPEWMADGVPWQPSFEIVEPLAPPDPNQILISAPDWGQNPSVKSAYAPPTQIPKAAPKHLEKTVGKLVRYPRTRPFTNLRTTAFQDFSAALESPTPSARNAAANLPPLEGSA